MSKYLISDLIFEFFSLIYEKSSKSCLKKRSLDISLQHKNEASYKFSIKKLLHLAKSRAGAERVNLFSATRHYKCHQKKVKVKGLGRNSSYLAGFSIFFHASMKKFNQLTKKKKYLYFSL